MQFSKNSSICFIGDSITAAEKYVRILVDYFVLHLPDKHILFHNVGIPGIAASTALSNWDELVSSCRPTHATVMFGMNDLQRALYSDSTCITDALLEKRQAALVRYEENMKTMTDKLRDVPHLIMTPTPHDESPEIDAPLYGGYDEALTKAGTFLKENFSSVLDLHAHLAAANSRRLVQTIIGPDRVHPGNIGHALIAHLILEALGFENPRLPLWDDSITEAEKAVLAKLGVLENTAPKNPYSDARSRTASRLIDFRYVEMNVLGGKGIDKNDTEKADAFLHAQLTMPIEEWRIKCYTDYLENRHRIPEIQNEAMEAMENMYRYV